MYYRSPFKNYWKPCCITLFENAQWRKVKCVRLKISLFASKWQIERWKKWKPCCITSDCRKRFDHLIIISWERLTNSTLCANSMILKTPLLEKTLIPFLSISFVIISIGLQKEFPFFFARFKERVWSASLAFWVAR